ncbi:hypothetical protein BJF83_22395 [Nocardiopsis sp. CNR-923]|uniref:hypothetical protein n=1 Tax=Nocardiopsis sp. CNR-923 TaxID=1904965 RepID=UPI0009660C33|nr:hypothetical protein [Nocardiopsis sp. CNR-923]OLT25834.1 hypothetical protein BJF83_22395 [Nocardiopsis sp. CNR-923]
MKHRTDRGGYLAYLETRKGLALGKAAQAGSRGENERWRQVARDIAEIQLRAGEAVCADSPQADGFPELLPALAARAGEVSGLRHGNLRAHMIRLHLREGRDLLRGLKVAPPRLAPRPGRHRAPEASCG